MDTFWWIFLGGVLMSAISLVGSVTLLLKEATLNRVIMPLVSFAAWLAAAAHEVPQELGDFT